MPSESEWRNMRNRQRNRQPDNDTEETQAPFNIELTDEALYSYSSIRSASICQRIEKLIDFLALHPFYGERYDPSYEAAQPPIDCRVLFCAHYGIYYHVNDRKRLITVLAIESQRKDPLTRFTALES